MQKEFNVTVSDADDSNQKVYDSSEECLNITIEEYRHITDRANKFDNKVYILITFCSIFFAFILDLLDRFTTIPYPTTTKSCIVFILCTIIFIFIGIGYLSSMIILITSLKPIAMKRFNPLILMDKSLWNKQASLANMVAVKFYCEFIAENNSLLENSYKKISWVCKIMSVVVILAFTFRIILSLL